MIAEKEAERIAHYLDMRTALPQHTDLVFVFGTRHPEPAYVAADLITRNTARFIVLTGGENRRNGVREAAAHLEIILDLGVPRESIIVESESTNTLENVGFALPKIARRVPVEHVASVVVVTKWYHCRRAIMTLKRHLPAGVRYFAATYELEGISRLRWWQNEAGVRRVLKEMDCIPTYLEVGDIEEIHEDDGVFV